MGSLWHICSLEGISSGEQDKNSGIVGLLGWLHASFLTWYPQYVNRNGAFRPWHNYDETSFIKTCADFGVTSNTPLACWRIHRTTIRQSSFSSELPFRCTSVENLDSFGRSFAWCLFRHPANFLAYEAYWLLVGFYNDWILFFCRETPCS